MDEVTNLVRLLNNLERVVSGHGLGSQRVGVDLSREALVVAEVLADGLDGSGQVHLDVVDVVEHVRHGVGDVDGDDLPVRLAVVDEAEHAQHLDGADAAHAHLHGADLDAVDRVVVAGVAGVGRGHLRVLPRLREVAVVEHHVAVLVVAQLAVLRVLLDRVVQLAGGALKK